MKKVAYDTYYSDENYFGQPYPGLVSFFSEYQPKGHVLDLGCGQGRDALLLGQLGYTVTGVDHSVVGITQLNQHASVKDYAVEGIVGNAYAFPISEQIDVVLLDSMLHFHKIDLKNETTFVNNILNQLREGAVFVNCMLQGTNREQILKNILSDSPYEWETLADTYTEYAEANSTFHLLAVKKRGPVPPD